MSDARAGQPAQLRVAQLAVLEEELARAPLAPQRQRARGVAERQDLEQVGEAEVLEAAFFDQWGIGPS